MKPRALMFQGTGSNVGKSVLVAGLARALTRRGMKVRPFKPQNMSNNAAVTADGGEIGRAQALQALACGVAPSVHMNPVLLKPQSEHGSQIIVQGRVWGHRQARAYQEVKPLLMPAVLESFSLLQAEADIVLVEGAGSASEVNLRRNDIANMGFAQAADLPVILIGDIDRGGVIASLVGTQTVLPASDHERIKGFIVNRMRGDPSLFDDGMRFIAERTGWAPCGLVPFFGRMKELPPEDTGDLAAGWQGSGALRIVVPLMPMIANFDDLDSLRAEPEVSLAFVTPGEALPPCDLVILPGSKATIADLDFFRAQGWDVDLRAHYRRGGRILGLCGGYQMLGRSVADSGGLEGAPSQRTGLGYLDIETELMPTKVVRQIEGSLLPSEAPVSGYEIHAGLSFGPGVTRPLVRFFDGRSDGAQSEDGQVCGTYLHGLFDSAASRETVLAQFGRTSDPFDNTQRILSALDALADHLDDHLSIDQMLSLC